MSSIRHARANLRYTETAFARIHYTISISTGIRQVIKRKIQLACINFVSNKIASRSSEIPLGRF
jgi:predicted nucleotidyltransferase